MTSEITVKSRTSVRKRAELIKSFRCKNLIAVIEDPIDIKNIGTVIRNVNALGVEKAYIVDPPPSASGRLAGDAGTEVAFGDVGLRRQMDLREAFRQH